MIDLIAETAPAGIADFSRRLGSKPESPDHLPIRTALRSPNEQAEIRSSKFQCRRKVKISKRQKDRNPSLLSLAF
jgi:hypothetical protein